MNMSHALQVIEEIQIEAPPDQVFRALTDPDEILQWWHIPDHYQTREATLDVRVGGRYRLAGTNAGGQSFEVDGEFRVVDPPHHLSYTWNPSWDDGAHGSIVDIRLESQGAGTRIVMRHTAFTTQSARDEHSQGWPGVLNALRMHAEGGVTA